MRETAGSAAPIGVADPAGSSIVLPAALNLYRERSSEEIHMGVQLEL